MAMPDMSNVFICQGGEVAAYRLIYRLIWGRFANEGRRKWDRGRARQTFSATC